MGLFRLSLQLTNRFHTNARPGGLYSEEEVEQFKRELPYKIFKYYTAASLGTFAKNALEFMVDDPETHANLLNLKSAKIIVIDDLNLNTPTWKLPFLSEIIDILIREGDKRLLVSINAPYHKPRGAEGIDPQRSIEESRRNNEWDRVWGRIFEQCARIGVK